MSDKNPMRGIHVWAPIVPSAHSTAKRTVGRRRSLSKSGANAPSFSGAEPFNRSIIPINPSCGEQVSFELPALASQYSK